MNKLRIFFACVRALFHKKYVVLVMCDNPDSFNGWYYLLSSNTEGVELRDLIGKKVFSDDI